MDNKFIKLDFLISKLVEDGYTLHFEAWRPNHLKIRVKGPFNVFSRTNEEYSECILFNEVTEEEICNAINKMVSKMNTDAKDREEFEKSIGDNKYYE